MGRTKLYILNGHSDYKLENIKQMIDSRRFTLNKEDVKKVLLNALTFLAPALLIFLTAIQQGVEIKKAMYLVYLWGLNVSIDLLKKLIAGKK